MMGEPLLTRYREQRETVWKELGRLLDQVERRGFRSLPAADLDRFGSLYRQAATHLAQLRQQGRGDRLAGPLNDLVVRAHSLIYRPPRERWGAAVAGFIRSGFPRGLRRTAPYQALAALILAAGLIVGWTMVARDPDLYYAVIPAEESRSPGSSVDELREAIEGGRGSGAGHRSAFTSFLWTHNTRVGILAFASGILAGIPPAFLLLYNGLMLGAMTALYARAGLSAEWWAWVLPHGVTELWAVTICAAAGLILGRAILDPGDRTRKAAAAAAAREAVPLAAGAFFLFGVAALLEGFFRQTHASVPVRYGMAALTALLWFLYLRTGRVTPARGTGAAGSG